MKRYISIISIGIITIIGCQKNFLDKQPQVQLQPSTALVTYANFQSYAWGLYDYFQGFGNSSNTFDPPSIYSQECTTDNLNQTVVGNQSAYAYQTKTIPVTGSASGSLAVAGWDFTYIRQVNTMLDAIDASQMVASDKNHWRSIGYFFRALRYYDLIAAFGSVPWIEHTLTTDSSELYAPSTSRDSIAQNILSNLEWAEANIGSSANDNGGNNVINASVIQALISRFGLFEGTYRKYHGLNNSSVYLQACATYSQKLMMTFPNCMSNFDDVFNTLNLAAQAGIILYKEYEPNLTDHETGPRILGSTSATLDVTKDAVDAFLCADGNPISTSPLYKGDTSMYTQFQNRDPRLYFTVVPPYQVHANANSWTPAINTGSIDSSQFITLMNTLSVSKNKVLPMLQWSQTMQTGLVLSMSPHFRNYNGGQPQGVGELGFFFWKYYNKFPLDNNTYSYNDYPLFRIEEVWLNYAEAAFELGSFNQTIANATINKLRTRVGLVPMTVANITANFDTKRDPTVDPVLWEVRRERRVELMGDGFRFNDLKRWAKGHYLDRQPIGVWINNAKFGNKMSIVGGGTVGYVQFFPVPKGWLDAYYLEPIPSQELLLNSTLRQNPGY